MNSRFTIVEEGCPACLILKRIIPDINANLPIDKRIRIIDNTSFEIHGIKSDLIQDKLKDEDFDRYPLTYIDGALIIGAEEEKFMRHRLKKLVGDDFLN